MEPSKLALMPFEQTALVKAAICQLPNTGILSQLDTGYLFLKVSDDFIHKLFPLIEISTKQLPDYFSAVKGHIGAHVSVIYPEEIRRVQIDGLLGKIIYFQKMHICQARLKEKNYLVIVIKSLELEYLRMQQGLSKKPIYQGFEVEFHITLANY